MATIYSTNFFTAPSFSGGPELVYTVPDGYVAVVRTTCIIWGDVAVSGVDAWIQTADLTKITRYTWASTLGDITNFGGQLVTDMRKVLDAGDTLSVQTAAGTVDISASGYLLSLP